MQRHITSPAPDRARAAANSLTAWPIGSALSCRVGIRGLAASILSGHHLVATESPSTHPSYISRDSGSAAGAGVKWTVHTRWSINQPPAPLANATTAETLTSLLRALPRISLTRSDVQLSTTARHECTQTRCLTEPQPPNPSPLMLFGNRQ
jgi:hypothetical protein